MRLPPSLTLALRTGLVAAAYYGAARLGLSMALVQENVSPVWPPSGIAVAAVAVWGARVLPGVAVASLAVVVGTTGLSLPLALLIVAGNVAEAWIGGTLATRLARARRASARLRDVVLFVGVAMLGALVSATVGALALSTTQTSALPVDVWSVWWLGNTAGILTVGAALLTWTRRRDPVVRPGYRREFAVFVAVLVPACVLALGDTSGARPSYPLWYLVFPFLIWASVRLGARGATAMAVIVSAITVWSTLRGMGPFGGAATEQRLYSLQAFVGLVAVSGLVLAALTAERERALALERRARRRAEAAERRSLLLAEVGAALGGSLDFRETLHNVARLSLEHLCDGCIIDEVQGPSRRFDSVVILHRDPERTQVLTELRRLYPPVDNPRSATARALHTGIAIRLDITDSYLRHLASTPDHLERLRAVGAHSSILLPLIARGRTLGVLTLMRSRSSPAYTQADLRLATEVGRRAATYVDNARLHEALQEESRARERVVSLVAHEVRNPLSTILLSATAVQEQPGADPLGWSHAVVVAAEQIEHLVQDLADITRLEAGRLGIERHPMSPAGLLAEAALMLEPIARKHGLRLATAAAAGLPTVVGSRDRTLQVFSNLVGNAVRFTPSGGTVTLAAELHGEEVRFAVADTGRGIPGDRLLHLFTPYWQVPALSRTMEGLGLPLSRAIVEAQGGRIWAESEPGRGTRFSFTLPSTGAHEPLLALDAESAA